MKKNMAQNEACAKGYLMTSEFDGTPMLTYKGEELIEECGSACESCPFKQLCKDVELWWGCGVWEEEMGDDL